LDTVKLNLGCGDKILPGYVNVDVAPTRAGQKPDVLREWARVLKPGAPMILECPNLQSACEQFLRDPDAFAGPGQEGQRTMWVFYGDPRWQDPLMVHRWGYTPRSLAKVMAQAGLAQIRQEPAQFKLREPRDMRLVGVKP
jgi:ubiquinone/menaquinone biosynthesis C-methylase UbiE